LQSNQADEMIISPDRWPVRVFVTGTKEKMMTARRTAA
jgi:hypothetical protein